MKPIKSLFALIVILSFTTQVSAKLSQPDYVLYGTATWFGGTLPSESEVSIYLNNQLLTAATYKMGADDNLNGLYALRVPMDSNDPRTEISRRFSRMPSSYKLYDCLVPPFSLLEENVGDNLILARYTNAIKMRRNNVDCTHNQA